MPCSKMKIRISNMGGDVPRSPSSSLLSSLATAHNNSGSGSDKTKVGSLAAALSSAAPSSSSAISSRKGKMHSGSSYAHGAIPLTVGGGADRRGGDDDPPASSVMHTTGTEWWKVIPRKKSHTSNESTSQSRDGGCSAEGHESPRSGGDGADGGDAGDGGGGGGSSSGVQSDSSSQNGSDNGSGNTDGSVSSTRGSGSTKESDVSWSTQGNVNSLAALMSGPLWSRREMHRSGGRGGSSSSSSGSSSSTSGNIDKIEAPSRGLIKVSSSENCAMLILAQGLAKATEPFFDDM